MNAILTHDFIEWVDSEHATPRRKCARCGMPLWEAQKRGDMTALVGEAVDCTIKPMKEFTARERAAYHLRFLIRQDMEDEFSIDEALSYVDEIIRILGEA